MEMAAIKEYLEKVKWMGFREKLEPAIEKEILLIGTVEQLYSKLRKGVTFRDRMIWKVKNIIGPYLLIVWKLGFSSVERWYTIKKYNVSTINELKTADNNYEFVAFLTSTHPSLYDSLASIVKRLNDMGIWVVVLTNKKTYRRKYKDLVNLKNCKFLFLSSEVKSLDFHSYLKASKRSKKQLSRALTYIKDEITLSILKSNRDFLELSLMIQNLLEEVYRNLFSKIKPKAIIHNAFPGALVKVAKENQIKTIMLQHGTQWGEDTPGVTPEEDELIIWGDFWKNNFRKKVSPKTKLVPLGCPRFDKILFWKDMPRENNFYNEFGLDENKKQLFFYLTPMGLDEKIFG